MAMTRILCVLLACCLAGAAHAADPRKVIRDVFPVAETGFDPAAVHDLYSAGIVRGIFETLYTYDYLARPAKIVPGVADGMPQVTGDGKVYTIKLAKGIHFQPDAAFGGKKRELTAEDVVYSYKRLADPKLRSPYSFLVEGKFIGLDEETAAAKKSGKFDYDKKIAGLEAVDRYTLRFRLKDTDYNLPYVMAHESLAVVAREVVQKYGESDGRVMSNPVGTGPYKLAQWVRSSKIVLEANPDYRGFVWSFAPSQPGDDKLVAQMKGKKMPQVGRVEISIMEEDQARWLAFQGGELDLMNMEGPLAPNAIRPDGKLKPELAAKGIRLDRYVEPEIRYIYWNMLDPKVGGLAKEKVALRRALAMSYDVNEEIRVVLNGQAVEAAYPIPPGVVGHEPNWKSTIKYDPAGANALLDKFGYKRGADGWRTWPDGTPMRIVYASRPDTQHRQLEELVKKSYDAIGVRMEPQKDKFPELLKLEKQCKLLSREAAWIADYPDGDNFMQLFYGPNSYQSNNACVTIPEYDELYKKSTRLPPGPERDKLYQEMTRILEAYAPHRMTVSRYRNQLVQPRVEGYRKHPILTSTWQYIDVATGSN
ncbi:MAG: ABC transporter substrate-binding protein [Burkholderiales bacterium]|nr:ABC transporter substrate-binding protein [Burkholderiales bacterium]